MERPQHYWYSRVAPLMEWSDIARGCVPLILTLLLFGAHLLCDLLILHLDGSDAIFDLDFLAARLPRFGVLLAGALALLGLGLWLRRQGRPARWFLYLTTSYYALALVWGGYSVGTLSLAAGVVLMGTPLLFFLLLDRRVVLTALTLAYAAMLALNLGAAWQWLPYAPLMHVPRDAHAALLWTYAHLALATPHLLVYIALASVVLGQWRLREAEVLKLGLTDELTGVHNRRSILAVLDRELASARRRARPLTLVILDLDHFKRINDTWGHPVGDRVLQEAARVLGDCLGAAGALGRFGGEEFLLVLPDLDRTQATPLVELCRRQLAQLIVRADSGETVPVRASFGLAWTDAGVDVPAGALVHAADLALYEAKQGGRDRLVATAQPCTADDAPARLAHGLSRVRWSWRVLGAPEAWRQVLPSVLEWSPVAKTCLMLGIGIFMGLSFLAWLLVALYLGSDTPLINADVGRPLVWITLALIGVALGLLAAGLVLRRRWPDSRLFQLLGLLYFGQTLVAMGYALGMLYMPTGAILIGAPLLGFLLFGRTLVLSVFAASVATVVGLSHAAAVGALPYAPLLSVHGPAWQLTSPFWMISNYAFIFLALLMVLALTDRVLGRWREREATVRALSMTDALTRVRNRRSILELLDQDLLRAQRQGDTLTVVLLDLDHFKRVNDTWGHPTGDRVLQEAARVLGDSIRESDALGRYGGEEFMLLLRDVSGETASAFVERCRARLAEVVVQADNGEPVPVSASFGVACSEPGTAQAAQLIHRADQALYRAKAGGRNRVEIAPPTAAAGLAY